MLWPSVVVKCFGGVWWCSVVVDCGLEGGELCWWSVVVESIGGM